MSETLLTGNQSDFLKIVVAAAGRGDLKSVRQLVDENPNWVHTVGSHGRTMLWEAVYRGKKDVVKFLVERGADVNAVGCHFSKHLVEISPYCLAKSAGREDLAEYLLANGAKIDIHSAAYLGNYNLVLSLLEVDSTLVNQEHPYTQRDSEPYFHATPVFYAVSGGHKEVVKLLISRGAEIKSQDERLLGFAMGRGVELVRILLENGIDPSNMKMGPPPKERELAELLMSYGAEFDVNAIDNGWPSIVYTSRGDRGEKPAEIQRLLDLGADVNIRDYKGKTALHRAAKAGFIKVMAILVDNGAEVNAADNNGETPLFDAIKSTIKNISKKKSSVAFLLSHGANPNFKNHMDLTPLNIARSSRREEKTEIIEMLQQYL